MLIHHRQLLSKETAAADLKLLSEVAPRHPRLAEFQLAPAKCYDAILFELLKVASRGDIVKNRMQASFTKHAPVTEEAPAEESKTEEETPAEEAPAEESKTAEETPAKKKGKGSRKSKSTQK